MNATQLRTLKDTRLRNIVRFSDHMHDGMIFLIGDALCATNRCRMYLQRTDLDDIKCNMSIDNADTLTYDAELRDFKPGNNPNTIDTINELLASMHTHDTTPVRVEIPAWFDSFKASTKSVYVILDASGQFQLSGEGIRLDALYLREFAGQTVTIFLNVSNPMQAITLTPEITGESAEQKTLPWQIENSPWLYVLMPCRR